MESGFGQNLEGFLIKGNLSLAPSANPSLQGDGSIEGSGTLYFDLIKEYNYSNGVNIQDVTFKNGQLNVPYTLPSDNATSASVIIDGGISVKHTQNAVSVTSGGGLTVAGGVSIKKRLIVGDEVDVSGNRIKNVSYPVLGTDGVNKDYVDSVASKLSGNFTTGQVIIADSNGDAIRGYDFFTTDTTQLNLSIPFNILSTGGTGLVVSGGATLIGNTNISGGVLNLCDNRITNVGEPIDPSDAVTKQYVDDRKLQGNFTTGQVIIADSNGDAIRGYDFFTTDTTQLNLSIPFNILSTSGSGLVVSGGSVFLGGAIVSGGTLSLSGNKITDLATPTDPSDAATKQYVDDRKINGNFTTGQLIIADSNGDAIRGFDNLTYDGTTITLGSTQNISGSVGGSFVCYGGITISKDVFIGGILDVNSKNIQNVATPVVGSDAVNKDYVDNLIQSKFSSFTAGQLIVADSSGSLRGYDNLKFDSTNGTDGILVLNNYTKLVLQSTETSTGLNSTSGALTLLGGASILKDVFIGGKLDVNLNNITSVADPIDNYDAVNKEYVDNLISNINAGQGISTNIFNLENNVLVPADIPLFNQPSSVRAFIANIYVQYNNEKFAFYTILGIHVDSSWIINSTFIGDNVNVDFYVRDNNDQAVLQYTNANTSGFASIRFSTLARIENLETTKQKNISISSSVSTFTDIPYLTYFNNTVDSIKLYIYVSSELDARYGLVLLSGVLSNGNWYYTTRNIGDVDGVTFKIRSTATSGIVQYTNTNTSNDYVIRVFQDNFLVTQPQLTLLANTTVPTNIGSNALTFQGITSFTLSLLLTVPDLNKSSLYEITGVLVKNLWQINTKYIGDRTGVKFFINTISGNVGVLQYKNTEAVNGYIRFIKNVPNVFEPLSVPVGGTGNSSLLPYAVLRGNGTSPIIGTDDFIYKDYQLILGNSSSIYINNTTNAIGLGSGGTLTTNGGASFLKDVYIGGKLDVNLNNIKSVATPIENYDAVNKLYVDDLIASIDLNNNQNQSEQSIFLNNGVISSPADIPGFTFEDNVKAFISHIYVVTGTNRAALYTIRGFHSGSDWVMSSTLIGDTSTGVDFYIREDAGAAYVQYTNQNTVGSTNIKYITDSIVYNDASSKQINFSLVPNTNVYTDIPSLTFSTVDVDSIKLVIYVSSVLDNSYGLIMANCVLKGTEWVINTYNIGNVRNIRFGVRISGSSIVIQYTNTNTSNDYVLRVINISIPTSQTPVILYADTSIPDVVDEVNLGVPVLQNYFEMTLLVDVPSLNKSAMFEIQGVVSNNLWSINYRYIGDYTGVRFYISTIAGIGYITYTNSNNVDANLRFIKNSPLTSLKPLQVNKGGTGASYLNPYTILRGNGLDPIIGTNDLIYEDNELILGKYSKILLTNTSSANSSTGSTFVAYGGVSINKELFVGDQLVVNNVDLTPNTDDITAEKSFNASNNVVTPTSIGGFLFDNTKSFSAMVCVNIETTADEYDALFELRGLKKKTGWILDSKYIGDDVGVTFSIASDGQIKYTSTNTSDWIGTTMKFRALTTT